MILPIDIEDLLYNKYNIDKKKLIYILIKF